MGDALRSLFVSVQSVNVPRILLGDASDSFYSATLILCFCHKPLSCIEPAFSVELRAWVGTDTRFADDGRKRCTANRAGLRMILFWRVPGQNIL